MGNSPSSPTVVPTAVCSTRSPEIAVEEAGDGDRVFVQGTMYHNGLNANAWGLTAAGAQSIADDLVGRDYVAAHPPIRGSKYDRSIAEGQGAPIGTVLETEVVTVEGAMLGGGEYTASYIAEVLDPSFKQKLTAGLLTSEGYAVSIGIYADPESADCSICGLGMAGEDCEHDRGERVKIESDGETTEEIAGPLFSEGESDHLAHVWRPAYDGATADVSGAAETTDDGGITDYSVASAQTVPEAASVLATPYDPAPVTDADAIPADASTDDTVSDTTDTDDPAQYLVTVSAETEDEFHRRAGRESFTVTTSHD